MKKLMMALALVFAVAVVGCKISTTQKPAKRYDVEKERLALQKKFKDFDEWGTPVWF